MRPTGNVESLEERGVPVHMCVAAAGLAFGRRSDCKDCEVAVSTRYLERGEIQLLLSALADADAVWMNESRERLGKDRAMVQFFAEKAMGYRELRDRLYDFLDKAERVAIVK